MNTSFTTSLSETIKDIQNTVQTSNEEYPPSSPLQRWNDDIELTFLDTVTRKISAATVIRKVPDDNGDNNKDNNGTSKANSNEENDAVTTVEEVSMGIHALVIQIAAALHGITQINSSIGKEITSSGTTTFEITTAANKNDISNFSFQTNHDADEAAISIIEQIKATYSRRKNYNRVRSCEDGKALDLLSQLIRASKNLIRWNRILLARVKAKRNSTNLQCQISGLDACYRLCSSGMVKLYLTLLEMNSKPYYDDDDDEIKMKMNICKKKDELAKNSCVALFHSTYGEAIEPICKRSLGELTAPSSKVYGIQKIMKLLLSSSSMQVTLALIKLIHNLVGSVSGIMNVMDAELKVLVKSENETEENRLNFTTSLIETNLISILVSTLAWSIRSKPPFPGNTELLDRRSEIVIEIIRVLFALQHRHNTSYKKVNESNPEAMTQLGVLIVDILHLPNKDKRVYECKVSVLILLMDAPKEFSQFLYTNHCVEHLLTILWLKLNEIIVEKEGMVQNQSSAASILPILILLNRVSQANKSIQTEIKGVIFPPERDDEVMAKYKSKNAEKNRSSSTLGLAPAPTKGNNLNPVDAPHGTLRWKLIHLMTWTESNVKRCASELLWTLCNGDSKEFVARTGFGNAVHMLGIKGLVNIPK